MAVAAAAGRAHGDEHRVGRGHRLMRRGGELQPPGLDVGAHQHIQPGLIDRHDPLLETLDLAGVLVDAGHVMTEISETGPGD